MKSNLGEAAAKPCTQPPAPARAGRRASRPAPYAGACRSPERSLRSELL